MEETLVRVVHNLFGGSMGRFIFDSSSADDGHFLATRDGLKDARQGQPAYFWSLFTEPILRRELLRNGWRSISKVFIIAVVLDIIYQLIVFRWFYPFETLIVAVLLALIPYLLVRGPVNRIKRR